MFVFDYNKKWSEESVAKRVAGILWFPNNSFEPYKKENGTWILDGGNDWFLRFEDGKANLSMRYEDALDEDYKKALQEFLNATMPKGI